MVVSLETSMRRQIIGLIPASTRRNGKSRLIEEVGPSPELTEPHPRNRMLSLLSKQVVQEFFVAGLRKLRLPRQQVREVATALLEFPLVIVGPSHIQAAMQKEDQYQISFWDALILAAAESGGAELLYTEDLNDGQHYGAVVARNPFAAIS